ncbi:sensor histidine kinase [Pseudonocardia asaccharolytica]|uniref:histidine kinase n=1 Tax=Pseudonocardia asaccharolytica DSM 44247 = NBRC 16224 TaxID=1123024 RepID=A0A511CWN2_9PSEU|nr:histidine kinase dimerization/phosphoacceptor domain-containing protein [Pseudonocardia asaccharolytica]GEL16962.1 hypothetical protein PA7_07990 [Pseudonocardia asaccharolytica DSM 44247 = NBRC 16224]
MATSSTWDEPESGSPRFSGWPFLGLAAGPPLALALTRPMLGWLASAAGALLAATLPIADGDPWPWPIPHGLVLLALLFAVVAREKAHRIVLEERARIARDLHDVVAHHMSLVVVQAETAPYRVPDLPDSARAELASIGDAARAALTETRAADRAAPGRRRARPRPATRRRPARRTRRGRPAGRGAGGGRGRGRRAAR